MKDLCVIACHFNPCLYFRPAQNYKRFCQQMELSRDCGLTTVQLCLDDDQDQLGAMDPRNVYSDVVLYSTRERALLWQKEALLNVLIGELADQYDALAWVDADVLFMSEDWVRGTLAELDRCPVAQLFSDAFRMDADGEIQHACRSFGWHWSTRASCWSDLCVSHPGYAWAARSEFLKRHKLYDKMITGCGDTAMLRGFTGDDAYGFAQDVYKYVSADLDRWAKPVATELRGEVGFVLGAVVHMYHGELQDRRNRERREFMRELQPEHDLCYDAQGLLQWSDHAIRNKQRMIKGVASYFAIRKEDGVLSP